MTDYLSLQKFYYQESNLSKREASLQRELKKRLAQPSTFRTGIKLNTEELFLAVPTELSLLSEQLLRAEQEVLRLWHSLPGIAQWAYLRGLIMNEIVSTNEIEGVRSTQRQVEEALQSTRSKSPRAKTKRFREFANLYLELTKKEHVYPDTPEGIRKIYDAVVSGELNKEDQPDGVLFRKETVNVVGSTQKIIHSGVTPESKIIEMIEQMIALVKSSAIPSIYSAVLAHFLFEYIHPFYDGNGRAGRYLLSLYLSNSLSLATTLSLSTTIAEQKNKYYKAFTAAESRLNHGEMTFFVIQMLEFMRLAQESALEDLEEKLMLLTQAENSFDNFAKEPYLLSLKEKGVMLQAAQHYLFDPFSEIPLRDIARYSKVSTQTARKYTTQLEEKGLLKTVSFKPLKFTLSQKAANLLSIGEA